MYLMVNLNARTPKSTIIITQNERRVRHGKLSLSIARDM